MGWWAPVIAQVPQQDPEIQRPIRVLLLAERLTGALKLPQDRARPPDGAVTLSSLLLSTNGLTLTVTAQLKSQVALTGLKWKCHQGGAAF